MYYTMASSDEIHERVKSDGLLLCYAASDEVDNDYASQLWPRLYIDDIIVTIKYNTKTGKFSIVKYHVIDKGLIFDFADSYTLSISIGEVVEIPINRISLPEVQAFNEMGMEKKQEEVDELISVADIDNSSTLEPPKSNNFIPNFNHLGLTCEAEKYRSETREIGRLVEAHEFGNTRNIVRLVARKENTIYGVALLDFDEERFHSNAAHQSSALYDYDMLRKNVIILRRMSIKQNKKYNKFHIQRSLIKISRDVSRALTDKKIVMLAGNSYEYQPAIMKEGFVCEVPRNPRNSLFYWLPVSGFVDFNIDKKRALQKVRKYLVDRMKLGLRE